MSNWVPQFAIFINGAELGVDEQQDLQKIVVDLHRQAPASVEMQFDNQQGTYDGHDKLSPGAAVKIQLGYTKDSSKTTVFEGEVIGSQMRIADNGPRILTVRAFDYLHRLTRGRKTKTFTDVKFSDVVQSISAERGLTANCDDTQFLREYIIQHNQTDLDFLRGIASWMDFDFHIRHIEGPQALRFKRPELSGAPTAKIVYEKPNVESEELFLRKFNAHQSLARVVSEVVVRGWDPSSKREFIGRASASSSYGSMGGETSAPDEVSQKWGETERQLVDYKVFSQEEADAIAQTKLNEYARTFLQADVEIQGYPKLQPGEIVDLSRVGKRFDGHYFLERVTHTFKAPVGNKGGYSTRLLAARCGW
ncbi:hypothetical protein KKF91_13925 [Myxococcota bacterium]|nr:hypothetical protein [Myxococcota bacterium]MBU1431637.1 hypothetical protein [Myxococcota bacterium]MBU1896785.1 hypothetical protein [Myxococcota bacterium]